MRIKERIERVSERDNKWKRREREGERMFEIH